MGILIPQREGEGKWENIARCTVALIQNAGIIKKFQQLNKLMFNDTNEVYVFTFNEVNKFTHFVRTERKEYSYTLLFSSQNTTTTVLP